MSLSSLVMLLLNLAQRQSKLRSLTLLIRVRNYKPLK
nr:MAG TPA: hypothetical protein [Caudoviricetes sp.]